MTLEFSPLYGAVTTGCADLPRSGEGNSSRRGAADEDSILATLQPFNQSVISYS